MLSRDPALIWNPLSEWNSQSPITPTQWIVHTAVDAPGPTNLHGYFENHSSLESHTWLRWDRHEQLMSFLRRADANTKANRFWDGRKWCGAISTETEDDGQPVEKPWNRYQLDELIRFGVWVSRTFGIPARLCPGPFQPGFGWHAMWGAPSAWTPSAGKTCPGPTRINQFKTIVLPAIQAELRGDAPPVPTLPTLEEIMAINLDLNDHVDRVYAVSPTLGDTDERGKSYWRAKIGAAATPEAGLEGLKALHHAAGLDPIG